MAITKRFLPAIPDGWKIYAADNEVAGIRFKIHDAYKFAKGSNQDLRFEREPKNQHDPDAIKVMGIYRGWFFTREVHIGYIPAEVVSMITQLPEYPPLLPRLKCIWIGGHHELVIIVNFDILVPKVAKERKPRAKRT